MNKVCYFILPLLGLSTRSWGSVYFINAYLTKSLKSVVIEVLNAPKLRRFFDHGFIKSWTIDNRIFMEHEIPKEFHKDVRTFLKGKYTKLSHMAKEMIKASIPYEIIHHEHTEEEVERCKIKILSSPHKRGFIFYGRERFVVAPMEIGIIGNIGSAARENLRQAMSAELEVEIDYNAELWDKPGPEEIISKELYNLKNKL